jgi:putative acetyltransferase
VLLSPCLLDAPRELVPALVLSPLGVRVAYHHRGIGSRLVRAALEAAEAALAPLVFLEGDPAYYGRLGFRAGSELGLRRPSLRIPEPGFQAALLSRHAPWMTGTMVYPDVWWRHDAVGLREPQQGGPADPG